MSLNVANQIARSGLVTTALSTSITSKNIANVNNPDSSQKTVKLVSTLGGVHLESIQSSIDDSLFDMVVANRSTKAESAAINTALDELNAILGDVAPGVNSASMIGSLKSNLQAASATPDDATTLYGVLTAATELVAHLNESGTAIINIRSKANSQIIDSANSLRTLLNNF